MDLRVPQRTVPKAITDWQYYMRTHREEIQKTYNERETTAAKTGIALRSAIAKEAVANMSNEDRLALTQAANDDWQKKCAAYKEAAHGDPSDDPDAQLE